MSPKNKAMFLVENQCVLIEVPSYFTEIYKYLQQNKTVDDIHEDSNNDSIYTITKDIFIKGMTKIFCKETKKKFLFTHLEIIENKNKDTDYMFNVIELRNHI